MLALAATVPLLAVCATGSDGNQARISLMTAPNDFDFFMGEWRVHHRRLVSRLADSNEWQEFEGQSRARNPHNLDVPVKGSFSHGVGMFFADDTFNGKPIKVRFLWLDTQSGSPRWEQAFSTDNGATWETNWTMQFTRS